VSWRRRDEVIRPLYSFLLTLILLST
jgi:hypothetical protein